MKCYKCGNEVENNAQFCGFCGNELNGVSRCVVCGKEIASKDKLCRNCLKVQKKKNNNPLLRALVVLLFVIVIILLCMGGFWFWCEWQDIFYTKNIVLQEDNKVDDAKLTDGNEEEQIIKEEKIWGEPHFESLRASSEYEPYVDNGIRYTYYIEQIRDDDYKTAWTPEEDDKKPWIKFSDVNEQKVNGIIIENGYSKTEELYYQNLRAKDILIECDDFKMRYTLSDLGYRMPETVNFESPVITKNLKITVLSVYDSIKINGLKFEDLSISELEIF